jgi:hypothetical protein
VAAPSVRAGLPPKNCCCTGPCSIVLKRLSKVW